jgi:hypothetical protein
VYGPYENEKLLGKALAGSVQVERFAPVWDACHKYGVTFDLECHPSERAMGDLESASDYIRFMNKAGYEGVVGFNLDGSHLEWQPCACRWCSSSASSAPISTAPTSRACR